SMRKAWSGCRKTARYTRQLIGGSNESVVVEGCHLAGIDRAVWAQTVPTLPDGCRPHRHRIEPQWAFALHKQVIGNVNLTDAAQCITDERRPYKAGADLVPTFAHERS